MKSKRNIFIAALLGVGILVFALTTLASGGASRYLVSGSAEGLDMARAMVGTPHHDFDGDFTADLTRGQVRALEALGLSVSPVELYWVSGKPSGKPGKGGGGGDAGRVYFPSDQTPWGIERVYNDGALVSTSGGLGVDIAVLDTGVNKNHLDLSRRVAQCNDFTFRVGIKLGACDDKYGHGTHVAGTILADGGADGLGIYGVAPEAKLFAYKVCGNNGSCWADDIALAIRWAADNGAEIVSMSLGGDSQSSLIRGAIDYATAAGVLVVAAAGNDGPANGSIDYPGANAKVMAVGATDFADNVPDWSSRGVNDGDYVVEEREVEFGAPGAGVESTWSDGSYKTISGTSMATPHISGLAAKLWQGSASATRDYLHSISQDVWVAGDDTATGFGLPHL